MLLAASLIFFLLLGGTDAGRLITGLRAAGAVISGALIAVCIWRSSRYSDRTDKLVVLALLAFVATCAMSQFPRFSFDAATTALALCAAFLVAREVVATEAVRQLLITVLGLCGLVLATAFAVLWGLVWIRWMSVQGAGLPPLDLILPVGPYRHFHVVGMTISLLLPAIVTMAARRGVLRPVFSLGILAAAEVILMSGSRTVWLATGVGLSLPLLARGAGALRRIPVPAYAALAVGAGLLLISGAANPILDRLAGTSTLELRGEIWTATLDRWLAHPLIGSGPGSFYATLTLSDYFGSFPDVGRHADNAVIQLLAEAGLLGLAGLGLLVAGILVGVRDWSRVPWAAAAGVVIFLLSSFTDNPSDTTGLVVIGLAWVVLAIPRKKHVGEAGDLGRSRRFVRVAALGTGSVLAAASGLTLLAGWSFDQATAAAHRGDSPAVLTHLSEAIGLDPSQPLYRREIGIWHVAAGDAARGWADLVTAFKLNPADASTARALALVASAEGDHPSSIAWAERAVRLRATHAENRLTLAYVAARAGEDEIAAEALTDVLRREPWIAAAADWDTTFPTGDALNRLLSAAQERAGSQPGGPRLQLADAWLAASVALPSPDGIGPDAVASAAVIDCRLPQAQAAIEAMTTAEAASSDGLRARVLVARAIGSSSVNDTITLASLRWPLLGMLATRVTPGASPFADPATDFALYRRIPMPPPDLGLILPTADSGMSAWLREPAAAADRGAPNSGLASCQ